jgi:hypothetical protein
MLKPNRAFVEFSRRLKKAPEIFQPWKLRNLGLE